MHSTTIAVAALVAVGLIHFSYVDFRFRHLDGMLWFWLMSPAPLLLWLSRAAIALAAIAALTIAFVNAREVLAFVVAGLVIVHIAILIAIEIRERG